VNGAFALLLGRDVPLIRFDINLSGLSVPFNRLNALPLTNVAPVKLDVGGDLGITLHLSGGYDTRGLRELLTGETTNVLAVADGFFLDSSQPLFFADGRLTLSAGPKVGGTLTVLGQRIVGAEAGIVGRGDFVFDKLTVRFDDPNTDLDNKFRPFYSDGGRNLFAASGRLSGSLGIEAYAEGTLPFIGTRHETLYNFPVWSGTVFDFGTKDASNPFTLPGIRPTDAVPAEYDFATASPLGHDGVPDLLDINYYGDWVWLESAGVLLAQFHVSNGNTQLISRLTIRGSADGTTFDVPNVGRTDLRVIGQADPGRTDTLDVWSFTFNASLLNQIGIGAPDQDGLSQIQFSTVRATTGLPVGSGGSVSYARVSQVGVHESPYDSTPSVVTVNQAAAVPLLLDLGAGDDSVNIFATSPSPNLAQSVTVNGNGGTDVVTFTKWVPTTDPFGPIAGPTDRYTITPGALRYESRAAFVDRRRKAIAGQIATGEGWPIGVTDIRADIALNDVEGLTIDEAVPQNADFSIQGIGAGQRVTVNGPLANLLRSPTGTYLVGNATHNLDEFAGTLRINDRDGRGRVILDDSSADPLGRVLNSDEASGTAWTAYTVTGSSVRRERTLWYPTASGWASESRAFAVTTVGQFASVEVWGGGGDNTWDVTAGYLAAARLVGGPGRDTFVVHGNGGGADRANATAADDNFHLDLSGGGGDDTFRYDDSAVADMYDGWDWINHQLSYTLTNDTATSGRLYREDHRTGHIERQLYAYDYDNRFYDDISFDGFETIDLRGAGGSPNTVWVSGNTAANLQIVTGNQSDYIVVQAPAPTFARGALKVYAGYGMDSIIVAAGTLDFADLQIYGTDWGAPFGQGDYIFLDDSASTVGHHYTVTGWGAFGRDDGTFVAAADYLYVRAGSGDDVFDVRSAAIRPFPGLAVSWLALSGGSGDDTFNLAADAYEAGTVTRTLENFTFPVWIYGDGGNDSVVLDDSGSQYAHTYRATGEDWYGGTFQQFFRDGQCLDGAIDVERTTLLTGSRGDVVRVESLPRAATFAVVADPSDWIVLGQPAYQNTPWGTFEIGDTLDPVEGTVEVDSSGAGPVVWVIDNLATVGRTVTVGDPTGRYVLSGLGLSGTGALTFVGFTPTNVNVSGGAGDDIYVIRGRLPGLQIYAGGGNDTLDYSGYTTGVSVNLGLWTATDIDRGVIGFENVVGGSGDDTLTGDGGDNILVGNAGNDVLVGGDGYDLLVGGTGDDRLDGGAGDDLLAGGSISLWGYSDINSLRWIESIWSQRYWGEYRAWALLDYISVDTASDPGDRLTGGSGWDWFWGVNVTDAACSEYYWIISY
jgi:Ca2+-binding RTX toxin-like protein